MVNALSSESFRTIKPIPFQGTVFRIVARHIPPLSLEGSLAYGGRYNPPYQFGALYCGLTEEICWAEIEKRIEGPVDRVRFDISRLRIRLRSVLKLTDSNVLHKLGVEQAALIHPVDYYLTRQIAILAREEEFEAILAPSAASAGEILAVFSDRLAAKSAIRISTRKK